VGLSGPFQVRVEGLQFDSGHFATFGGECEPLHGHTYSVAAEIDGTVSSDAWVIDFIALKAILRSLCDEIDHRFLLQKESPLLKMDEEDGHWRIETPAGLSYLFPQEDVAVLPIDNTTTERLAEWLCGRLWQQIKERRDDNVEAITIEVWEGPDQRASFRSERRAG
jgi:6-pyruvoyltetrahydropterin/6-carboxytetrahydropterin synthase